MLARVAGGSRLRYARGWVGGSGRQLGLERFSRGAQMFEQTAGRSGGHVPTLAAPRAHRGCGYPSCWTRTTFQPSGSAPREPPMCPSASSTGPARRPARMLNKTVGDRSVKQVSPSCSFREFPLAAPRGLRLARWWRRYRNGARSTRRTCRTPRPTPTPTPTSLRPPSPTPPLAGSVGRSARLDARRETVQPLAPSEPPSR